MTGLWQSTLAQLLPLAPSWALWPAARRYIAGETLDAMAIAVAALNAQGARATVDLLSEDVTDAQAAERIARQYEETLSRIARDGLNSHVSVKPSALGLALPEADGPARCENALRRLIQIAADQGAFVRLDMEDATRTDATLALYDRLRAEGGPVGVAIQAYLKRSESDVTRLCASGPTSFRLCKGIYRESPAIALRDPEAIRRNYLRLLACMIEGGASVGLATHDDALIAQARQWLRQNGVERRRYEFQMLYGVRESLRQQLLAEGEAVRVYVPFGADWRAYSLRRLRENPAIAGHIARAVITGQ